MVIQEAKKSNYPYQEWKSTIGRVAFMNCDPLFLKLSEHWNILSAPPSWLTGHLLRRDCIIAPIPAADYAKNTNDLILIPDLGICSKGEVGSVLLFGNMSLEEMQTIALPSDSSSSVELLKYILKSRNLSPKLTIMGPDIDSMLSKCDGALLIGDRALNASRDTPKMAILDLGVEWENLTGLPMVFGVFAARKDTPIGDLKKAHSSLLEQLEMFEQSLSRRKEIVEISATKSGLSIERLDKYFGEVFNRLDGSHIVGLNHFLVDACGVESGAQFRW